MDKNKVDEIGQKAFEAYNNEPPNAGKTFDGRDVPPFVVISEGVKHKWKKAASEIALQVGEEIIAMVEAGGVYPEALRHTLKLRYSCGEWDGFANRTGPSPYKDPDAPVPPAIGYTSNLA